MKKRKITNKKKEYKEEDYLDLRPKPQMAPILMDEPKEKLSLEPSPTQTSVNEQSLENLYRGLVKNLFKYLETMRTLNWSENKKSEEKKTIMALDNSQLDNTRRPNFALQYYLDSLNDQDSRALGKSGQV